MQMMRRLLDSVNRSWNSLPKDVPVLSIMRGSGQHFLVSVDSQQLYFHSTSFRSDMPVKQTIYLEDYTLSELVDTINSMGYQASINTDAQRAGLLDRKAFTLIEVTNVPMLVDPANLTAFTSSLWEIIYPIARLLDTTEGNIDLAIQQMIAASASGRWLDYWATFFKIKRIAGESDKTLAKRILMSLVNLKTNNLALKELIEFSLQTQIEVRDEAPALFSVVVDPAYIETSAFIHSIVSEVKAAGVDYFINYASKMEEDYPAFYQDRNGGLNFRSSDTRSVEVERTLLEEQYGRAARKPLFILGKDKLVTGTEILDMPQKNLSDTAGVQVGFSEQYVLPAKTRAVGQTAFVLNESHLNSISQTIYGEAIYGDIIGTSIERSETYPKPSENGGTTVALSETSYRSPTIKGLVGFRLGFSATYATGKPCGRLAQKDERISAGASMTMTQNGVVVRSMTL